MKEEERISLLSSWNIKKARKIHKTLSHVGQRTIKKKKKGAIVVAFLCAELLSIHFFFLSQKYI